MCYCFLTTVYQPTMLKFRFEILVNLRLCEQNFVAGGTTEPMFQKTNFSGSISYTDDFYLYQTSLKS